MGYGKVNQKVCVSSPSNIAFIKYWGKSSHGDFKQWPTNSSLSMTLKNAFTQVECRILEDAKDDHIHLGSEFKNPSHAEKRVRSFVAFLKDQIGIQKNLEIKTNNNFPESCGIASSASSFSAICLAVISCLLDCKSFKELAEKNFDLKKLSDLARMGSGSACRSLAGGYVLWNHGDHPLHQDVSMFADASHWTLVDCIFVCNAEPKKISSSEGHKLAWTSPVFKTRIAGMDEKISLCKEAIQDRDLEKLGFVLESEALDMHAVMQTSTPSLNYLSAQVYQTLECIRSLRKIASEPAYFTLDAGSSVHLITVPSAKNWWKENLSNALSNFNFRPNILEDEVGHGPIWYG